MREIETNRARERDGIIIIEEAHSQTSRAFSFPSIKVIHGSYYTYFMRKQSVRAYAVCAIHAVILYMENVNMLTDCEDGRQTIIQRNRHTPPKQTK